MSTDSYYNDHTIKVRGDTQTVTIDQNLDVLGDLDVQGQINATYADFTVTNNLTVGNNITVGNQIESPNYFFDTDLQVMKVIPNSEFWAIIDTGDATVVADFTWGRASTTFAGSAPDTYIPIASGASPSIEIPIDPYVLEFTSLHSVAMWAQADGASTSDITIELQQLNLVGTDNTWSTIASDIQTLSSGGRTPMEFDMSDTVLSVLTSSYQLVISTDGVLNIGMWRTGLLFQDNELDKLLGKFP